MSEQQFLNAREFTEKSGISGQTLTRLLREGKIKGEKVSGKWVIPRSELNSPLVSVAPDTEPVEFKIRENTPPGASSPTYTIAEFSRMTYLTEKGVLNWLKKGRLTGRQTPKDGWRVDAANLDVPDLKWLVRKI